MISRIWHGWTKREHADEHSVHYETILTPDDVRRFAAEHSSDGR